MEDELKRSLKENEQLKSVSYNKLIIVDSKRKA
jgi:hypothetical protein